MKKILFITLFLISILSTILIILSIKNQNILEEKIITINRAYFYKEDKLNIKLYSNSKDSFLLLFDEYELYLSNDITTLKTTIIDVYNNDIVLYQNNVYYEYILNINLNTKNINLENTRLDIIKDEYKFSILIGNIYFYEEVEVFNEFTNLYGLSFNEDFKTIAGIVIKFNQENKNVIVSIPNYNTLKITNIIEEEDVTNIEKYINDYKDKNSDKYNLITDGKAVLCYMDYQNKLLFDMFPLYINYENENYLIKPFKYLEIHNLDELNNIINVGVYDV